MLTSIIVPAHNSEKTLEQCLKSVLLQDGINFEVIVVDNKSTDKTKEIIEKLQRADKRIKYVFEPRQGRGAARNAGINSAKGEIIAMTDSDCVVPKNWLKTLISPIIFENEKAVMGGDREMFSNFWTKNLQKKHNATFDRLSDGKYINIVDTKNFALKTDEAKKIMFDSNLCSLEDVDFYMRSKKKFKIRFLKDLKVFHHHRTTFLKVFLRKFEYGFSASQIYKKNSYDKSLLKTEIFGSLDWKNYFKFPVWIFIKLLKTPPGEVFYTLIYESAWRAGALYGFLFFKYPNQENHN